MSSWATRQGSPVLAEECGDGWAVHLELSGMTHLVDSVSGEVLCFLAAGAQSLHAITTRVSRLLGDQTIAAAQVEQQWLRPLEAIGLLEERL